MTAVPPTADQFPTTLYGIHDLEGASFFQQNHASGWLVHAVNVWNDPAPDYRPYLASGLRVLVRLNNGYGSAGTIPVPSQYDAFAARCAAWVAQSQGAKLFIIGNEMNASGERPNSQPILPADYASCFARCRAAIQSQPGFAAANVIPGAVAPYNIETTYPANLTGDWIKYFQDMCTLLQGQCDGLSIHCYGRGTQQPGDIANTDRYPPPYQNNYKGFLAYRNFMGAIPATMRNLPIYVTETEPIVNDAPQWLNQNTGWVDAAFAEISNWNASPTNQPIQALALFRWLNTNSSWCFSTKPNVLADFRNALARGYSIRLPNGVSPGPSLQDAVKATASAVPWMPVNNTAALWKYAQAHGLQDQQTDELHMTYNGVAYLIQVFNLGILYVQVGDWGNIHVIPK
jgi:hypothetical protein